MKTRLALHGLLLWILPALAAAAAEPNPGQGGIPGWPDAVREEWFRSRADGTMQPTPFPPSPGGSTGTADEEYRRRSASTWFPAAAVPEALCFAGEDPL